MQGNQLIATQALEQSYKELPAEPHIIPYDLFTDPMSSDVTAMCLLCHRLSHYDIKGAIDLAYSFIVNRHNITRHDEGVNMCITSPSGLAVVQCIAKLMHSYFVNKPLLIPLLSSIGASADSRYQQLDRVKVTRAVAKQDLSLLWHPDHALKLLLLSGLWEEAVQFPLVVGDWKKAFLLSVLFGEIQCCFETCLQAKLDDNLGHRLMFDHINSLLDSKTAPLYSDEMLTEVTSMIHTAALCSMDTVLVRLCYKCLEDVVNAIRNMDMFVPQGVHLPSPPAYCPQPSVDDCVSCVVYKPICCVVCKPICYVVCKPICCVVCKPICCVGC